MKMKFVENDVNEVCNGNDMNGMCDYVMEQNMPGFEMILYDMNLV